MRYGNVDILKASIDSSMLSKAGGMSSNAGISALRRAADYPYGTYSTRRSVLGSGDVPGYPARPILFWCFKG